MSAGIGRATLKVLPQAIAQSQTGYDIYRGLYQLVLYNNQASNPDFVLSVHLGASSLPLIPY